VHGLRRITLHWRVEPGQYTAWPWKQLPAAASTPLGPAPHPCHAWTAVTSRH